ncbi:MAG: hypothetical protein NTW96_27110 [Planctomycetia bacterium]|nr:hypothetical protein [Planctomycetia bacterium]
MRYSPFCSVSHVVGIAAALCVGALCGTAPGEVTTLVKYDYEHMAQDCPFRTGTVDAGAFAGVGQIITIPEGAKDVCGVRFKVSKAGSPGALGYRLGRTPGGSEIAQGTVPADDVIALYDLLYGGDFAPQAVKPGEKLYLTLAAERGAYPDDYYLVYGPRDGKGIPQEARGAAIAPKGRESFPLSYRLLTSVGPGDAKGVEERFEFVRRMTRPPYSDARILRDPERKPRPNEVAVTSDWTIVAPPEGNVVMDTAVADLRMFFERVMDMKLNVAREPITSETRKREKAIILADAKALAGEAEGLQGSESYRVIAGPGQILLCGADDRGAMRAAYYLEDKMGFAAGPFVEAGTVTRRCMFSPRLTQRVGPFNTFLTELSQPTIYTDGFLSTISHQGFNGLYLYGNLEELTYDSKTFPELNNSQIPRISSPELFPEVLDKDAVNRRYQRLNDLIVRAKKYGVDVYLYYATNYHHPVPEELYKKYPDCRGVGWGRAMCTSNPRVERYLAETTRNLFRRAPGLKGLVMIFDSEGFMSCATNHSACPRCKLRNPEDIAAEFITTVDAAMKEVDPQTELIAWSYYTGHPKWVAAAIPKMPKDVTFQANFGKGSIVERGGVRHVSGDYLISEVGPPPHFVEHAKAVVEHGMKLSAKTEHSYANEFVNVPYIPIPQQFHRRVMAIRQYPVRALLANWTHQGYSPNPNAEILKWYSWDNEPPIDRLLLDMASREYGAEAAPGFVRAWGHFSKAITYYPYSDSVARHPGPIQVAPAQPLYLDPKKKVAGDWRSFVNDLGGTQPWGPEIAVKYFGLLDDEWQKGLDVMSEAMDKVPAEKQPAARREFGIAKSILCSVRSYMNVTRFFVARQRFYAEPDKTWREAILAEMRGIAEAELTNAREALVVCEADSRIGYASGGSHIGGLYTPASIRAKIEQVEKMIGEEMPRMAAAP